MDDNITKRTCPTCKHYKVCGAYKTIIETITDEIQFDARLVLLSPIYVNIAKMCRRYSRKENTMDKTIKKFRGLSRCPDFQLKMGGILCNRKEVKKVLNRFLDRIEKEVKNG